jgi:PAS domain S-box-containing protein
MSWNLTRGRLEGHIAATLTDGEAGSGNVTDRLTTFVSFRRFLILRSVAGASAALVAMGINRLFPAVLPWHDTLVLLWGAIVLCGWLGGRAAGISCGVAATLAWGVWLLAFGASGSHWADITELLVFVTVSAVLMLAVDVLAGTSSRLRRYGARLRERTHRRAAALRRSSEKLKRAHEVRTRLDEDFRLVLTHARCILWHAALELSETPSGVPMSRSRCLLANVAVHDEQAAQKVLRLQVPDGLTYASVWVSRRHPQDALAIGKKCLEAISDGRKSYRNEYRCFDSDGQVRWLAEDVQISSAGGGRWRLVGVTTDVTERRLAESALRASEDRFTRFMECLPGIAFLKGEQGRYVYMNDGCQNLMGMSPANYEGRSDDTLFTSAIAEQFKAGDKRVWNSGEMAHTIERVTVGGHRRYYMMCRFLIATGSGKSKWLGGIGIDITNHRNAEAKVLEQRERLRSMATDLTRTEERERRQIATALHDQVGTSLALARIRLEAAANEGTPSLDDTAVREAIGAISTAIEQTRSLTYELSAPILYEAGLEAALGWLGDDIGNRYGIEVAINGDGAAREADQDVQIALFQVTRELLINVVKHAKAKTVLIGLCRDGEKLRLQVADDGVGIDPLAPKKDGFGLFNIRERLRSLGGWLEIESEKNGGARAIVVLPIRFAKTESHAIAHRPR